MSDKCEACNGLGWLMLRSRNAEGERITEDIDCEACKATGIGGFQ